MSGTVMNQVTSTLHVKQLGIFQWVWKKNKPCLAPHLILSDHSRCISPYQGISLAPFSSSYFYWWPYVELKVGMKEKAYLHHIYCKVKNRIQGGKLVILSDQDVHMYGYSGWYMVDGYSFCVVSLRLLILFESMAIFRSLLFFLFFLCLDLHVSTFFL